MMDGDPFDHFDPTKIDPGVRMLVSLLRQHGFETTDSGDGKTKGDDGLDVPHVHMTCHAQLMAFEADRLHRVLSLHGVTVQPIDDPKSPCIQATYDPAAVDSTGVISLFGVTDAMIRPPSGSDDRSFRGLVPS